ncbi:hypothetical protein GCM10022295_60480 [Streptomyces osmaniensis]|uniref:Uncharacterized protein n=1 Tax=Streptomyces osmaniensis TaxID=593134 RepID=A0ABP6XV27_9ACTN
MDNPSGVDAGMTATPVTRRHSEHLYAPCLTCGNAGQKQGALPFPHRTHKIRHTLWTTGPLTWITSGLS